MNPRAREVNMMKRLSIIFFLLTSVVSAQVEVSGLVDVVYKEPDNRGVLQSSGQNVNHRGDGTFNPVRVTLFFESQLTDRISATAEILYDDGPNPIPTSPAFDANVAHPLPRINGLSIDIGLSEGEQATLRLGKIQSPFGTFADRSFSDKNPLIGIPLMYQLPTTVRGDKIPTNNDVFLEKMRGKPWQPAIYESNWDVGMHLFGRLGWFEYGLAAMNGDISNPDAAQNTDRAAINKNMIGRLGIRLGPGWKLGFSGSRGAYFNRDLLPRVRAGAALDTTDLTINSDIYNHDMVGFDYDWNWKRIRFLLEGVLTRWEVPNLDPKTVSALMGYAEFRWVFAPRWYVAVRYDMVQFNSVKHSAGGAYKWDRDLNRLEGGFGVLIDRGIRLKIIAQWNDYVKNKETIGTTTDEIKDLIVGAIQLSVSL